MRSVEEAIRSGSGERQVVRVDLHGVSVSTASGHRTAIRWEWIEEVVAGDDTVVRAASGTVTIPGGTFGLEPGALAVLLDQARSITRRTEVIQELSAGRRR